MLKNWRVAAYITAYEDLQAVESCVKALQAQSIPLEAIFIVDNSTRQPVMLSGYENVIVDSHPENLGVAGGLKLGLDWALARNYDFLWAFDQDSIPTTNCLEILLERYNQFQDQYKVGIIAPTPIDHRSHRVVEGAIFKRDRFIGCQHNHQVQFYECDAPITSGSLISIAAARAIAPPRVELFIDGVDHDYGIRLKNKDFHNLIVPQAILHHQFADPVKIRFLQKDRLIHKYSALRHYYICRNHTYLETRQAQGWYRLTCCRWRLKFLLHTVVFICLTEPKQRLPKTWACLIGTFHGLIGKLGKTW